jgi:hypothetical protein
MTNKCPNRFCEKKKKFMEIVDGIVDNVTLESFVLDGIIYFANITAEKGFSRSGSERVNACEDIEKEFEKATDSPVIVSFVNFGKKH